MSWKELSNETQSKNSGNYDGNMSRDIVTFPWHYCDLFACGMEFLQTLDGQGFWMEVLKAILCEIILHDW